MTVPAPVGAAVPLAAVAPVRRLRLVVVLGALSGLTPLAIDAYLPALPAIAADLGATPSSTQLTLTALLLGLAVGQAVAGPVSDTVGRRGPVLVGLVGFTIASLLCALAPSVPVLVALRFLQGATGAAGVVAARAVVRDLYEGAAAARMFASLILVMGVAPVLAPVLGAQVLRVTAWQGVFVLLALLGLLLLLLSWRTLPESLPPERRRPGSLRVTGRVAAGLLRDRRFLAYVLAGGFGFAAMFTYISGSSFALQQVYGLSPSAFSGVFAANAVGFVAMSQVSGRLVARTGASALLVAGSLLALTGSTLALVAVLGELGLPVLLPGLSLVVASLGFIAPNATALALSDHGAVAGTASALLGILQYGVAGAAAPLAGLVAGSVLPMTLTMVACAGAAVLLAVTAGRMPHPVAVAAPIRDAAAVPAVPVSP